MNYNKQDATMTQGIAIISMLILHLFCRKGADVYGTPLFWISNDTPFVYYLGFFAEICVPLYSICAGYARQISIECGKDIYLSNVSRGKKLLINYWVVLVVFCFLGLVIGSKTIPGDAITFLKNVFLIKEYNGAWWYVRTYLIVLLIPSVLLMAPVRCLPFFGGALFCGITSVGWYLICRFGILSADKLGGSLFYEVGNMMKVLPSFWMGGLFCKYRTIPCIDKWLTQKKIFGKTRSIVFAGVLVLIFCVVSWLEKSVLMFFVALIVFLGFNLSPKTNKVEQMLLFFGRHSTNIWLTHMFFYLIDPFKGLAQLGKYPILIFANLLFLSLMASYVIAFILRFPDYIRTMHKKN